MRTAFFTIIILAAAFLLAAMASPPREGRLPARTGSLNIPRCIHFHGSFSVDADGSPAAYHPERGKGLDRLRHAGRPGRWYGILTANLQPYGNPVVQQKSDPRPGYFISITTLFDRNRTLRDPRRYTDAEKIPYIALPPKMKRQIRIGDLAVVYNRKNGKHSGAVFADIAPAGSRGEGSIALAENLGINACPRSGGQKHGLYYLLFPGSGKGQGHIPTVKEIRQKTDDLLKRWGGIQKLKALDTDRVR